MTEHSPLTRRAFLQGGAAAAVGSLSVLSPTAYARILGANNCIRVGVIGLGTMGQRHLQALLARRQTWNLDILQTCDVSSWRASQAASAAGPQARSTQHYEEVLDNKAIDAVFIATPDHWHARMALDAIGAGKHVYLETPLAHTAEQAWELARVAQANKHKVCVQVGVPSAGGELLDKTRAYLQGGGLGKLLSVHSSLDPARISDEASSGRRFDLGQRRGLDWDRWLGFRYRCAGQPLAEACGWDPQRYSQFRRFWAYSGGWATDRFFHRLTRILKMTGLDYPDSVLAGGGGWLEDSGPSRRAGQRGEVPALYNLLLEYPAGPTVRLIGSPLNDVLLPDRIVGEKATISFNDPDYPTRAEILPRRSGGKPVVLTGAAGSYQKLQENFFQACRTPSIELLCPVDLALRANIASSLGVKAFRESKCCHFPTAAGCEAAEVRRGLVSVSA